MSSSKKQCTSGNTCYCGTKKAALVAMSCLFMVAMSYIYGALLALPAVGIVVFLCWVSLSLLHKEFFVSHFLLH